jgi:integrase
LSVGECEAILHAARHTRWFAAFYLLVKTGVRPSELLGITWDCIDWDAGPIRIERQTGRVYGEPGVRLLPLQTAASRRSIPVGPPTLRVLQLHRQVQERERAVAERDGRWIGQNTVFCQPNGGLYFRSQLGEEFARIAREVGVNHATPKTFRHTAATRMQEHGEPLRSAQALLGHATERTTHRVYSHATPEGIGRIAVTMDDMFAEVDRELLGPSLTERESA